MITLGNIKLGGKQFFASWAIMGFQEQQLVASGTFQGNLKMSKSSTGKSNSKPNHLMFVIL